MSNTDLIIPQRSRDIGDFLVGRFIPFRKKRMVGPFVYIDHMGPVQISPKNPFDIDQHPHIGLSTLTYLLEGEVLHADSMGSLQHIKPGSVNWMTAGSGATHTERTPEHISNRTYTIDGYQVWVALPAHKEDVSPSFHHIKAEDLPVWIDKGTHFKLIAGEAFGRKSPVPVYSDLFMVEIINKEEYKLKLKGELKGEVGVLIHKGSINACGQEVQEGNMLVSKIEDTCQLSILPYSHIILFGGTPFPVEHHINWNFVSSDRKKIMAAIEKWKNNAFPKVPDDNTYIPYPS